LHLGECGRYGKLLGNAFLAGSAHTLSERGIIYQAQQAVTPLVGRVGEESTDPVIDEIAMHASG
jgi:hypothetical protein